MCNRDRNGMLARRVKYDPEERNRLSGKTMRRTERNAASRLAS
jgi:hypothetical protein